MFECQCLKQNRSTEPGAVFSGLSSAVASGTVKDGSVTRHLVAHSLEHVVAKVEVESAGCQAWCRIPSATSSLEQLGPSQVHS